MQLKSILVIGCFCASTYVYAATTSTLWGEIDEPVPPISEVPVAPAPIKTICDVLTAQTRLDLTGLNSTDISAQLRSNIEAMPDEYKALVSNNDGIAKLYQAYRDKYLKVYCGAPPSK